MVDIHVYTNLYFNFGVVDIHVYTNLYFNFGVVDINVYTNLYFNFGVLEVKKTMKPCDLCFQCEVPEIKNRNICILILECLTLNEPYNLYF